MQTLQIGTFPLQGIRLIEASAGTGKTYTIAGLYLRLLFEQKRTVSEILVVTFTEAATAELRGRVRKSIYDALQWLEGRAESDELEQLFRPFRGDHDCIQHLRDALARMDEAAIFTIHSFCQRTLTDSAFETGVLFEAEFVGDESEIRQQVCRDFWRREVAGAGTDQAAWVREQWATPDELLGTLGPLIGRPDLVIRPQPDEEGFQALVARCEALFDAVREGWLGGQDEIRALLDQSPALSRAERNYRQDRLDALYVQMNAFLEAGAALGVLPERIELLTATRLRDPGSLKKNQEPPRHECFSQVEDLLEARQAFDRARGARFLALAADYLRTEIERRKQSYRILFFDDLIGKLDQALQAEGGDALARRIRGRYPVAMIDEFQDTDPQQYRIFRRIYPVDAEGGLFMIADPKQAIYSFRGADIFTYMQARRDTDPDTAHFTLGTNWRSHSRLVSAVNALFERAESPFIYDADIPFHPVRPAGKADEEPLTIDGLEPNPLVCWFLPIGLSSSRFPTISKERAKGHAAGGCAAEIARLLTRGRQGEAKIAERALEAQDIAVLVRDRFEAATMRDALRTAGVASVYFSRDSVFDSEEARDLAHLLRAVAEPANDRLVRTALATRLMGVPASRIQQLSEDESAWEEVIQRFQVAHRRWNTHGFLPMFHDFLRQQRVIAGLLGREDGERRMTNLLQLAELAHVESVRHPGIDNLLRWLADARANPNGNREEQQLRLESDENLVRIVTIHKSKGLEYPIVFLPFIWSAKEPAKAGVNDPVLCHDEQTGMLIGDVGSADRGVALAGARRERLAEDLRLLYVALTRAKYRCYFTWGKVSQAERSGLAWLLHQARDEASGDLSCNLGSLDDEQIRQDLQAVNPAGEAFLSVEELPSGAWHFRAEEGAQLAARPLEFEGDVHRSFELTSFSGLVLSGGKDYHVDLPEHDLGVGAAGEVEVLPGHSRFAFPRGAQAGLFMHHLLETIDFPSAGGERLASLVGTRLAEHGFDESWQPVVTGWLTDILDTSLDDAGRLRLRDIPMEHRLVELGFHFPVEGLDPAGLNGLLAASRGEGRRAPSLDFPALSGYMKGFVDLIFEHEGRFYVLDYKSNHLGNTFNSYGRERLEREVVAHHYDLQYLIYTLALHRYLRQRKPGYHYEEHFGGVYYLFLRGMQKENGHRTGVHFDRPGRDLLESLDDRIRGEGGE